jgi:hypothetical protein
VKTHWVPVQAQWESRTLCLVSQFILRRFNFATDSSELVHVYGVNIEGDFGDMFINMSGSDDITFTFRHQTTQCSGNVPCLYSGCLVRLSAGTPDLKPLVVFPSLQENSRIICLLDHDGFLPNPVQFILPLDGVWFDTESIVKYTNLHFGVMSEFTNLQFYL